jgi:hypothetical protein
VAALAAVAVSATTPVAAGASNGRARILDGPYVSGTPQVGSPLTATGSWTGATPITPAYAWLRCADGTLESCVAIADATGSSYVPVAADAGSRLRVRLEVRNAKGWSWAIRSATDPIAPAPVLPTPAPAPSGGVRGESAHGPRMITPRPVVRVRGWLTRTGARITGFTVRAPRGARITVRCGGSACPRRRWAGAAALVHVVAFERVLRAGTRITVTVTRRGFVGKHTVILVRRGRPPARVDRCLFPGSARPRACPGG